MTHSSPARRRAVGLLAVITAILAAGGTPAYAAPSTAVASATRGAPGPPAGPIPRAGAPKKRGAPRAPGGTLPRARHPR